MKMDDLNIDGLCVICLKESQSFYCIYDRHILDNSLIYEVINDICQLDITMEDESAQFICSECYTKLLEFHSFKREAHKARATYLHIKGNSQKINSLFEENNLCMDVNIGCKDAVTPVHDTVHIPSVFIKQEQDFEGNSVNMEDASEEQWDVHETEVDIDIEEENVNLLFKLEEDVTKDDKNNQGAMQQEEASEYISTLMMSRQVELRNEGEGSLGTLSAVYDSSHNISQEEESSTSHPWTMKMGEVNIAVQGEHWEPSLEGSIHKEESHLVMNMLVHSGKKAFECKNCRRKFTHKECLVNHLKTHAVEKPFQCQHCGKKFSNKGNLAYHLRRIHIGGKPFECHCGKRFYKSKNLFKHLSMHSGEIHFGPQEKESKSSIAQKKHRKPSLQRNINKEKSHPAKHVRTHSREIAFECQNCGKRITHQGSFLNHLRTCTEEKLYECHCGERFHESSNLFKHFSVHSGEIHSGT